ncbi:threonylcarbamoyl-AMP synthase, partial [Candidatus Woesearchaeota archaeon]|nr:threonylcarbamoyl-AMP synthase [Candidatus Woesearchaeota archaeon]
MKTEIIKANDGIIKAVKLLISGEIVAFPTETVYGLGACALNKNAVKKIFKVKGRPADDPLIVHIGNLEDIKRLTKEIPPKAMILMKKFWPGPLTLVLRKSSKVPLEVSAGLETVAVRMPANKIALELCRKTGPIAAPSANSFGKPSPTKAKHVYEDLKNKIPL